MSRLEKTPTLQSSKLPNIMPGGRHEDARGALRFCNDFDMTSVKRFYTIANSAEQPKRGWIMHKRETKWFFPLTGVTKVEVEVEDVRRIAYLLDSEKPQVLEVPPEHWFLIDQCDGAEVMVFSNCFVGEFENDNFRKEIEV